MLYNSLADRTQSVIDAKQAAFTSFDAYKYAVCGVPFREKWKLSIVRDRAREQMLYDRLVKQAKYAVCHLASKNFRAAPALQLPPGLQLINEWKFLR